MLGDGFQYYVRHVGDFPHVDQMLDIRPLILCKSNSKYKQIPKCLLEMIFVDVNVLET